MSQCFKCKQSVGTIASRDGPKTLYCADCFLRYCSGVMRDNLFQQCFAACDTPLAVAVSGGPNSMLLLHELGQLRCKAQQQQQQQQQSQEQRHRRAHVATSAQSSSNLELLPFHLSEAELILPPSLSASTAPSLVSAAATAQASDTHATSEATTTATSGASLARQAAVERARAYMGVQFDAIVKLVQQQPSLWVYRNESLDFKNKKKHQQQHRIKNPTSAPEHIDAAAVAAEEAESSKATSSGVTAGVKPRSPVHLFENSEVRVFQYSDFLPPDCIAELRHALHVSKLSLTDREALYDRVRQQVLCRAARRVTDEYRQKQRHRQTEEAKSQDDGDTNGVESVSHSEDALTSGRQWYHLLLGDNAAHCAVAALEAVVTGAGGEGIVHASAFRGFLHEVVCLRPMRTLLPKETVLCTRLQGITSTYTPALCTGTSLRSMHQVLEQFVHRMILSFRTMVFNVLNTVQKLSVHPESMQELVQLAGFLGNSHAGQESSASVEHTSQDNGSKNGNNNNNSKNKNAKALSGRTAQQNYRDLLTSPLPHVCHSTAATTAAELLTRKADFSADERSLKRFAVQCCVCGCPVSVPAQASSSSSGGTEASTSREVEVFAVRRGSTTCRSAASADGGASSSSPSSSPQTSTGTPPPPAPALDCYVCYACRSLFEAWPETALTASTQPEETESKAPDGKKDAVFAACSLFQ